MPDKDLYLNSKNDYKDLYVSLRLYFWHSSH